MKGDAVTLRSATPEDAKALLEIYAPYIERTAITFEYTVPTVEEFRQRIADTLPHYPYIVAEYDGNIVGYAYAGLFKERAAYSRCVETSIYIRSDFRGKGAGTALYDRLEEELARQGILNVNACITWTDDENEYLTHQSPLFHAKRGYEKCAHFHKCGYKFGRWFDVIWMEKMLGEHSVGE